MMGLLAPRGGERGDSKPITMVMGNLVAATALDDVWAVFRVRCASYGTEPRPRQEEMAGEFETFARAAEADCQILRVTKRWDADAYTRGLLAAMPARAHKAEYRAYAERQRIALQGSGSHRPSVWLAVRLADPERDWQARVSRLFEHDWQVRERMRGFRDRMQVRHEGSLNIKPILERARIAQRRVEGHLEARPATPEELQWLVRRAYTRGLGDPIIASGATFETPWEETCRQTEAWLAEDSVTREPRHLVAHSELGDSYQTALCLAEQGHAEPFSSECELMFSVLEEHDFPADACLNLRWVSNDQGQRLAKAQVAKIHHQVAEEADSEMGADDDSYDRSALAREYHGTLKGSRDPMLMGSLSLIVGASSLEEMNRQCDALRQGLPWEWNKPTWDMREAFQQHLPAQRRLVNKRFELPFTPRQLGAMVPHATHEAGSDTPGAFHIGRTLDGGHPVLFDLREASMTNEAPTIALVSSLGGGKTMLLQLLMHHAWLRGARIVDIDPKGDHRFHELPRVRDTAREIYLGPDARYAGMLDPLRIAADNERHDAAATFLLDVLPTMYAAQYAAAINGAITRVIDRYGDRACCWAVIEELQNGIEDDQQRAGYQLAQFATGGIARLGFAGLSDPLVTSAESQVTYIQTRALKRAVANTSRSEMSQSQQHGRAVLQLVALYAMKILGEDKDWLKFLSFDETSFVGEDAYGQQLLDQLTRWGRSDLAVPVLSTQLLGDISAQDNLIGQVFYLKMRSRDHARLCLDNIELDGNGRLSKALTSYRDGQCLFRDLRGHTEEMQVEYVDQELFEALETTPEEEAMALQNVG